MNYWIKLIGFLIANFAALGLGSLLMGDGPTGDWYQSLALAPWTPPGWVFGFAWTTIMLLFSFYMAHWLQTSNMRFVISIYIIQWILNVAWNWVFFNQHLIIGGLIILVLLLLLLVYIFRTNWSSFASKNLFLVPYILWMCIAFSLNFYILLNN